MTYTTGAALLDAVVLAIVSQEETYGYKISQEVQEILEVSESTLYPVLRRLQKENCLETFDKEFAGRNRRYYKITSHGMILLDNYRKEWKNYRKKIDLVLYGKEL